MTKLRETSKRRINDKETVADETVSEPEQSIFRNTFLKRSEVSSFLTGEENSLKFMTRGHTTGNLAQDPKLD